jgi:putative radical SAM enzyme (TIGR03279 family)
MVRKSSKTIASIVPGSIAEEAGIEPGDVLVSVNGKRIRDIFEYRLSIMREELVAEIAKRNGETWEIEVRKDESEDLGIEFENPMADEEKRCTNKCIFCFIDQLPPGMRDTLYFKDDDARLSFIYGNYITMTNMDEQELDRIIGFRLSPVNISVHTTNPELRKFMLNNPKAGNVLDRIKKLVEAGITVNCQIVLCRGINDGAELDRTLNDLTELHPGVASISVVPVGLTKYRQGLYNLEPYNRLSATEIISYVSRFQERCLKRFGSRIVFIADELYLTAGVGIPVYDEYESFPQIENGVGMLAFFQKEFLDGLRIYGQAAQKNVPAREVSIATGTMAVDFIDGLVRKLANCFDGLHIHVYGIRNYFFGDNVSVSGLVTGRDMVNCLKDKRLGKELLIPRNMLKADEPLFLDGYDVDIVQKKLGVPVTPIEISGLSLIEHITGDSTRERLGGD